MFKNSTVRTKLTASFGLLALMVLIVAGVSLKSLSDANDRLVGYVNGVNARALLASQVRTAVDRRAIAARNLVLVSTPQDIAVEKEEVLQAHADVQSRLADLNAHLASAADATDTARSLVGEIGRVEAAYGPVALGIVKLALDGKKDEAIARINTDCRPLLAQLVKASNDYRSYTSERAQLLTKKAGETYETQRDVLIAACVLAFAAAVSCGVLITRGLTRALGAEPGELSQSAQRIAAGNLGTIRGAAQAPAGSVLSSLGAMQVSLARIVGQVPSPTPIGDCCDDSINAIERPPSPRCG